MERDDELILISKRLHVLGCSFPQTQIPKNHCFKVSGDASFKQFSQRHKMLISNLMNLFTHLLHYRIDSYLNNLHTDRSLKIIQDVNRSRQIICTGKQSFFKLSHAKLNLESHKNGTNTKLDITFLSLFSICSINRQMTDSKFEFDRFAKCVRASSRDGSLGPSRGR